MSSMSTHVLDLVRGGPARTVPVRLDRLVGDDWQAVTAGQTDDDGRIAPLIPSGEGRPGTWRIRFDTGAYFAATGVQGFYPYVEVVFVVEPGDGHYHVPLLLGPYGYSTYRGS